MRLDALLKDLDTIMVDGSTDTDVRGLAYDSRKVMPGDVFFCIRGVKEDGHTFAAQAVRMGAKVLIVDHIVSDADITQIVVPDTRIAMARMASSFFGNPTEKLKLIGITGTNGKTTTSFMVDSILRAAGHVTGMLGTVEYRIADERLDVSRTTPESLELQSFFAQMVERGVTAAVMEVSSHAIDLSRIEACDFDVLAFTNLSQDHLDYHNTMDDYFTVKRRIFDSTAGSNIVQVINFDDPYGREIIAQKHDKYLRYSTKDKVELNARNMKLRVTGSEFLLEAPMGESEISLRMPGMYNIYNALAAAGCATALEIPMDKVREGLEGLQSVPGRFERVDCGQDYTVIVDYAHTPDSIEKVLTASRELTKNNLLIVFGCGGDRDKTKRPQMGKIAAELSDIVIITSDNPRTEEPHSIIEDILEGINDEQRKSCVAEYDREKAIRRALELARSGDFVVVAGKGHENGQEIGDKKIPFDDVEVVKAILMERACTN